MPVALKNIYVFVASVVCTFSNAAAQCSID